MNANLIGLKLRQSNFRILSRSQKLYKPSNFAEEIYQQTLPVLKKELDGRKFRLLGVSSRQMSPEHNANPDDLFDAFSAKQRQIEKALDKVRGRFGTSIISKGRGFEKN